MVCITPKENHFPNIETAEILKTRVPANVKFEVDDAEESWTFPQEFDYVHCRYLAAAISDWPKLVGQCFQATKAGGYSEFQDYSLQIHSDDGSVTSEHAIMKWNDAGLAACDSFGKDHSPGPKIEGWMKEAGFVDVHYERFPLPIGPWPKDKHLVKLSENLSSPRSSFRVEWGG